MLVVSINALKTYDNMDFTLPKLNHKSLDFMGWKLNSVHSISNQKY